MSISLSCFEMADDQAAGGTGGQAGILMGAIGQTM